MNAYELADELKLAKRLIEKDNELIQLQADRIAELEKAYAELNHKALALGLKNPQVIRIAKLEKDLHMLQRHYDQLESILNKGLGIK